ncbi:MAG: hypothetical protein A2152_00730 [Candidatus Levybacteria bacterium RBG_16_35_6]|nr:MAG: hypothetical protein A2152_00730 [Candidatus Levybacteria bacterium RBG_16_35_6]
MSQADETFFTSIGCMDGRVQDPISEYGKNRYSVKYMDTITEAGLVGIIGSEDIDEKILESIKKKVLISINKHHSKGIVVHGHQDCAGNPIDETLHREQTINAAREIRDFVPGDIEVMPVFVVRDGENWKAEEL